MRFSLRGLITIITLIALGCGLAVSFQQNRKLKAEKAEEKAEQVEKMDSLEVQLSRSRSGDNLGFPLLAKLALNPEYSELLEFLNSVDRGGLGVTVFPFEPDPGIAIELREPRGPTFQYVPQTKGDRKELSLVEYYAYPRKPDMDITKPVYSFHWDADELSKWKYAYLIVENDTLKIRDFITTSGAFNSTLGGWSHPKGNTCISVRFPDGGKKRYAITESGFELVQ